MIRRTLKNEKLLSSSPSRKLGKSKGGLTKGGLSPKFSEKIGGEILPAKSGLFGANWDLFRAYRGLFGADRDQFLRTPQPRGKSRNCPERALFGPIGAFRAKPPFAKPPFGFPRENQLLIFRKNIRTSKNISCHSVLQTCCSTKLHHTLHRKQRNLLPASRCARPLDDHYPRQNCYHGIGNSYLINSQ